MAVILQLNKPRKVNNLRWRVTCHDCESLIGLTEEDKNYIVDDADGYGTDLTVRVSCFRCPACQAVNVFSFDPKLAVKMR